MLRGPLGSRTAKGVIHRDIKVDNIMFDDPRQRRRRRFRYRAGVSGYTGQTGTNMVVGTPQYFAPEQARAKPLDGRADLYSLGVTLYRAATGRLPFVGDDWYEIARQHVEEPPPTPRSFNPTLSPEFETMVMHCLAKRPDDRPATGELLADAIAGIRRRVATPPRRTRYGADDTDPSAVALRVSTGAAVQPASRRGSWSALPWRR